MMKQAANSKAELDVLVGWTKFAMAKQGRMKGYGMDYSMKIIKEIYKSQVYCVKNKTFINFALENRR